MKIHSAEVRGLALAALERGEKRTQVSGLLEVPVGTLDRWRREFRRSGKNVPAARGHKRAAFPAANLPRLEAQLRSCPDATLQQQAATWRQNTGQNASRSSVQRALKTLGWSRKKESDRH
jgi:transposase